MFSGVFEVFELIRLLSIICCIFVPLGLWKLIEIVIWLFNHVTIK